MISNSSLSLVGYQAAYNGAAFFRWPDSGYLRIGGADRLTYIQRQTTNDTRTLAPGRAVLSALTSATARILDVWRLIVEPESETIGVITLPGRAAITARYLQSRIFFMDKVTVANASAENDQLELCGPATASLLEQIGLPCPAPDAAVEVDGLRGVGIEADRWVWIGSPDQIAGLVTRLESAGAVALDAAAYDLLRIEAGRPGPARELTEDYTPLETNLDAAISDSKGCYTGQEIIARQVTYDKVVRRLAGLRLDIQAAPGDDVQVDGRTVGVITSAVESPRLGPVALAVLRRPHHTPGTAITVGGSAAGVVAALPFDAPEK